MASAVVTALARKRFLLPLLVLVLVFLVGLLVWVEADHGIATTNIGQQGYRLEVVKEPAERQKGLSNRDSLAQDGGMLFIFDRPDTYCFWMKDTRIPLDMVWLDSNLKIVHIERYVQPNSYPQKFCPGTPAFYVVELPAGVTDGKLQEGDTLQLGGNWRE